MGNVDTPTPPLLSPQISLTPVPRPLSPLHQPQHTIASDDTPPPAPPAPPPSPPCEPYLGLEVGDQVVEEMPPFDQPQFTIASNDSTPLQAPPAPPPSPPYETHIGLDLGEPEPRRLLAEWLNLVMSFCFTAITMGFQSIRASDHLPMSFYIACLGTVFALAAFVVSKYMPAYLRREAQWLESTGVFFGITGFFLDITLFFPPSLKMISWLIYAISLLALIILTRYFSDH